MASFSGQSANRKPLSRTFHAHTTSVQSINAKEQNDKCIAQHILVSADKTERESFVASGHSLALSLL